MKKLIFIGIGAIMLITSILAYGFYLQSIDTRYTIMYSQVFGSCDINKVDKYLNEETIISYNGVSKSYKEIRGNVINAFKNKKYEMVENSSYGSGNSSFFSRTHLVNIQSYVDDSNKSFEVPIIMGIEIKGINKFSVKSLSSHHDFLDIYFLELTNNHSVTVWQEKRKVKAKNGLRNEKSSPTLLKEAAFSS